MKAIEYKRIGDYDLPKLRLRQEESKSRIILNNGTEMETDFVLISAGIRPRLDIIKNTEINHDKGIKVDRQMKTNVEDVYAAGDVVYLGVDKYEILGITNNIVTLYDPEFPLLNKQLDFDEFEKRNMHPNIRESYSMETVIQMNGLLKLREEVYQTSRLWLMLFLL